MVSPKQGFTHKVPELQENTALNAEIEHHGRRFMAFSPKVHELGKFIPSKQVTCTNYKYMASHKMTFLYPAIFVNYAKL